MKKITFAIVSILIILAMSLSFSVSAALQNVFWIDAEDYVSPVEDYAYSFALVGDTQTLVREDGGNYAANKYPTRPNYTKYVYDWLIDNAKEKKIAYVMGLGDICEMSSDEEEWKVAQQQILRLNGVLPYSLVRGNHDDATWFKVKMGVENPEYMATIEGSELPGKDKIYNNYRTLHVAGDNYLIMVLDYYPTDSALEWANEVIADHPYHKVIITTHSYIKGYFSFMTYYDLVYAPHRGNNGKDIWDKLVKHHENIFMVICGHVIVDDVIVSTRRGKNGNTVYEILVDPQGIDDELVRKQEKPAGLIAMLYFSEDGESIGIEYYSTIRNQYMRLVKNVIKVDPDADKVKTTVPETTVSVPTGPLSTVPVTSTPETTVDISTTEQPETITPDSTEAPATTGGCGNAISLVAVPTLFATLGGAVLALRKKRER